MPFVATWMDLEGIMLSEIHQTEKEIQGDLIYMWNLKYSIKTSLIDTKNILVIARSGGGGAERMGEAHESDHKVKP